MCTTEGTLTSVHLPEDQFTCGLQFWTFFSLKDRVKLYVLPYVREYAVFL